MLFANPLNVPVVTGPAPVIVDPPGDSVTVHAPKFGNPVRSILPVTTEHVGWLINPITGAVGIEGCILITALEEDEEVHPDEAVTVNV